MKLCITKPPAKASSANSADRRSTTRCDRCRPRRVRIGASAPRRGGTSMRGRDAANSSASTMPDDARSPRSPAGTRPTARRRAPMAQLGDHARRRARRSRSRTNRRAGTARRCSVRRSAPTSWLSDACSTARNGPTSLPLGLITPIVAATSEHREHRRGHERQAGREHQAGAGEQRPAAGRSGRRGWSATARSPRRRAA